jgi:hypothetical protein
MRRHPDRVTINKPNRTDGPGTILGPSHPRRSEPMTPRTAQPLSRHPALAGLVAVVLVALLAFPGAASAEKLRMVHFVDHNDGSEVFDYDDCGEDLPLTVFTTGVLSADLFFDSHGTPDPNDDTFVSITATFSGGDTITNTINNLSATAEYNVRFRNSAATVLDSDTGEFAMSVTNTGSAKLRGPDGKVLWHGAGLTRSYLVLIPNPDSGPTLVSEDILFRAGKEAEGDFCQVLTTSLGL